MDHLSTNVVEKTKCMRSEEKDREEEEEEEKEEEDGNKKDKGKKNDDLQTEESAVEKQQTLAWVPFVFSKTDKEVYYYTGQKIIIEGAFDSYAGMTWPGALALSHYLDTHQEQLNLMDKAVLEIGAGTGLVSVVAALLGAWVTATDLPEVLNHLRVNLSRNTRGHSRHTPQVAALPWGFDLESTYPSSVYRYDYILASDVVYHHDCLDELLATMKHFCKPGTTVIWANKFRLESDLAFTEKFKKAFHTSLLSDNGDMKIFMATCREEEEGGDERLDIQDMLKEEKLVEEKHENELHYVSRRKENNDDGTEEPLTSESERGDNEDELVCDKEEETKGTVVITDDDCKEHGNDKGGEASDSSCSTTASDKDNTGESSTRSVKTHVFTYICQHLSRAKLEEVLVKQTVVSSWAPSIISSIGKDIYHYAGQDIVIYESIDSYGAVMWPAALALCSFLDNNRQKVNLQGKKVLELGAGTGLVTIVASLLGASVTATDLPEVLSNLRANVMRNTRGRCEHMPQVEVLSWGFDLKSSYPSSVHHYDYVLAADVVYHHDFLDKLLATMKHFCKPGTTVIWANKVRFESDLAFTEKFKKAFHTSLLSEDGDMKIFTATCRE